MNEKRMILMIDDDSMMLQRAYEILEKEFDVRQAKSAKQGFQLLTRKKPDLILLDISMPEMDGYETFEMIRKMENGSDVPVIFLTSLEDPESEVKGISMGAVDYIHKPFVPEILISRVTRHLEDALKTRNLAITAENNNLLEFDPEKLAQMEKVLSDMEFQVAKLVAVGYENQEISDKLMISYSYEKQIVSRVLSKLGVKKRYEVKQYFVK